MKFECLIILVVIYLDVVYNECNVFFIYYCFYICLSLRNVICRMFLFIFFIGFELMNFGKLDYKCFKYLV